MPPREEIDDQSCDEIDALAEAPTLRNTIKAEQQQCFKPSHKTEAIFKTSRTKTSSHHIQKQAWYIRHNVYLLGVPFDLCTRCEHIIISCSYFFNHHSFVWYIYRRPLERPFEVIPPHRDAFT